MAQGVGSRAPGPSAAAGVVLAALASSWTAGNVGPIAVELSSEFDVSLSAVGLLSGTLYYGTVIPVLLLAPLASERLGLVGTLRLACVLLAAGNAVFALSPDFGLLAAGRVLVGAGLALVAGLAPVLAREIGGVRLVGVVGAAIQIGIALALILGALLGDADVDWRVGIAFSALVAVAPLPFLRAGGSAARRPHRAGFARAAVGKAWVYRLSLLFIGVYGVPLILAAWLVTYLTGPDGGLAQGVAGSLSFVLFGVSAAGRIAGARLEQRGARHVLLGGSMALAAAGMFAIAIDATVATTLPATVGLGLGMAIPYAMMLVSAQRLFPAEPAEPVSMLTLVGFAVPVGAVPAVGAALDSGDGELAILALAGFLVVATLANLRPADRPVVEPHG